MNLTISRIKTSSKVADLESTKKKRMRKIFTRRRLTKSSMILVLDLWDSRTKWITGAALLNKTP